MNTPPSAPLELLSPAGTCAVGRAAIDAGADAVYIGGSRFGAREAAGNPMDEIAGLTRYAHLFGARVYLTMNTLLMADETAAAQRQAWEAWEAGVDALIVQDMAYTQMKLPPIALHASTQTFNLTPDRVRMLEEAGFSRVVLERGATLEQIQAIRAASGVELEAFIHGAVCVSYSGQCYLGHAVCGRGGNRGGCAQPCRAQYDLTNEGREILVRNRPLLSVRDLNLSERLGELAEAGVCSFKIEGRLKEQEYVVNNTAYYHRKLESLGLPRSSVGEVTCTFEPNPSKSFSRGFSEYYFGGKETKVMAPEAKSIGERIGRVRTLRGGVVTVDLLPGIRLNNGDGICFTAPDGRLQGTNVNRADGNRIEPNRTEGILPGTELFRNYDHSFAPSTERRIPVGVEIISKEEGNIGLKATDTSGVTASVRSGRGYDPASNPALAEKNLRTAATKAGDTPFTVRDVTIRNESSGLPFVPAAELNALRRGLFAALETERLDRYERPPGFVRPAIPFQGSGTLDYHANIANPLAEAFFKEAGYRIAEQAFELLSPSEYTGRAVMRTPYCIRRELDICMKEHPAERGALYLENNGTRLKLVFDCAACEMAVVYLGK